jgi:tRNA G18 (ribose-2'-O)-methylase SpoU
VNRPPKFSAPSLVRDVESPDDARLADYVRLRDTSLRKHLEFEQGLFIAEGEKVIRRAVRAGYRPRSFLLAERWLDSLADVVAESSGVPVYVVSEALAEEVTGFHVHRGALASLRREHRHHVGDLLAMRRLVVCEDIVDHTNVGAVLRNVAGLGWDGVLLSPRSADPLYRRSIKVSMGTVFSLPWARLPDWHAAPALLQDAGFLTVALTLADDAVPLPEAAAQLQHQPSRLAVLVGTEGAGLSPRWADGAAMRVRIPMCAGVDSLNVAAATAVACYALGDSSAHSSSSSSSPAILGDTGQSSG